MVNKPLRRPYFWGVALGGVARIPMIPGFDIDQQLFWVTICRDSKTIPGTNFNQVAPSPMQTV